MMTEIYDLTQRADRSTMFSYEIVKGDFIITEKIAAVLENSLTYREVDFILDGKIYNLFTGPAHNLKIGKLNTLTLISKS